MDGSGGMRISIHELIERTAEIGIEHQREDGSFQPRSTSYYGDTQRPIRVTSQWLRLFAEAYSITNNNRYSTAANKAVTYLLSRESRPKEFTLYCRESNKKDRCNGLYGQAIPAWSLIAASNQLSRQDISTISEDLVTLHPYNRQLSLWNRVEINGEVLSFDRTLNHQIAFAAACSLIKNSRCERLVNDFLDTLKARMAIRNNGIIRHLVKTPYIHLPEDRLLWKDIPTSTWNRIIFDYHKISNAIYDKEIGYQAINLFWLSMIKDKLPDHNIWKQKIVDEIVGVIEKQWFKESIEKNEMAFNSSPTGFYLAIVCDRFLNERNRTAGWIEKQIYYSYESQDEQSNMKMLSNPCYLCEISNKDLTITLPNGFFGTV